jgi:CRISPR-associated protein Cas1
MSHRILEISEEGALLRVENHLLVVEAGERQATVPLMDLACVVLGHRNARVTHPVLAGLAEHGAGLVVIDAKHQPVGMLLPLVGHSTQARRFRAQAEASLPRRKRLWQQIVQAKIRAQARLLVRRTGKDYGLRALAKRVRSGDPGNLEAQAAQRYWPRVFGDTGFRRRRDGQDQNRLLNYGYAILRAITGRALCGAGLHPGLGLNHQNQYDRFPLASDLMEPCRPLVDGVVARLVAEHGAEIALGRETKTVILEAMLGRFEHEGEMRTLFDLVARSASSLAQAFLGERQRLDLPEV